MRCPFCDSALSCAQKKITTGDCVPVFDYYYYCKDKITCGWAGRYRLDYVGTIAPSQKGMIDEETFQVNKTANPMFKNGLFKPSPQDIPTETP